MQAIALLILLAGGPAQAESFASWSSKAQKALKRKDAAAAVEAYSNALRLWKKTDGKKAKAQVLAGRAALYEEAGDWQRAVADLTGALEFEKNNHRLYHRRGRAYLEKSDHSRAIDDFIKAIKLKLDFKEAYADRARAYERQGELKFAAEDRKIACRLGLKSACPAVKAPPKKTKRTPARSAPTEDPAVTEDFDACLRELKECVDDGGTYDQCVAEAESCPGDCVKEFRRSIDGGLGEAETFRTVFSAGHRCNPLPYLPRTEEEAPKN